MLTQARQVDPDEQAYVRSTQTEPSFDSLLFPSMLRRARDGIRTPQHFEHRAPRCSCTRSSRIPTDVDGTTTRANETPDPALF